MCTSDKQYLEKQSYQLNILLMTIIISSIFQGVISISGVYDLHTLSTVPIKQLYLHPIFSHSPTLWTDLSPISNVHKAAPLESDHQGAAQTIRLQQKPPPFCLLTAQWDLMGFQVQTKKMVTEMKKYGFEVINFLIPHTTHFSVMANFGRKKKLPKYECSIEQLCLQFLTNQINTF